MIEGAISKRAPAFVVVAVLIAGAVVLAACGGGASPSGTAGSTSGASGSTSPPKSTPAEGGDTKASGVGIHKIKHVIIIMQENRSFDSYFGTFPGADGIRMKNGKPAVCLPDPGFGGCQRPYADHADENHGGGHWEPDVPPQIDGGRMDGFLSEAEKAGYCKTSESRASCDVMGYHTGSDIPNYWAYAKHFVLHDRMFEPVASWTVPSHLYLVSNWAASCRQPSDPMTCRSYIDLPVQHTPFGWTDLTYLLHKHHVSWGWYLDHSTGAGVPMPANDTETVGYFNVLHAFTDVAEDRQTANFKTDSAFFRQARTGTLPAVSWLMPDLADSEHPTYPISTGQSYVTRLINAVMRSPDWDSSAIFLAWDDWGGFYDNVPPPKVDRLGYGLRVPSMVISPYAKAGYIDHQTLSFDAYNKFIEDDFLNGERLNPKTDGRPDNRPDVRESKPILGNLAKDFDFDQQPRPPFVLPVCPKTTLTGVPDPAPYCS